MRNIMGNISMLLGVVLLVAALSLFLRNGRENEEASEQSQMVLKEMLEAIDSMKEAETQEDESVLETDETIVSDKTVSQESEEKVNVTVNLDELNMKGMLIGGYEYIGYVVVPDAGLELPVMSGWDYTKLKIAPCRYTGSTMTDDLVIAGHNYRSHFSKIKNLQPGALVYFTDMNGIVHSYEVVNLDVLTSTAVEEMTSGEYDLTLFTCTYGGQSRFALRCDRI